MELRYRAIDAGGRTVEGELEVPSEADAVDELRRRQLIPVELVAPRTPAVRSARIGAPRRATKAQLALVLRELATMLAAGVGLAEAVENVATAHRADRVGPAFDKLGQKLRSGEAFARALEAVALDLPDYVYVLARAGELTGKLAQSLADAAAQMEYDEQVRQDARNALVYPTILVTAGLAAVAIVFAVVVPRFASLLTNPRADLPAISVIVLRLGLFSRQHWPLLAGGAVALAAFAVATLRTRAARVRLLNFFSRWPVVGPWIESSTVATWSSVLSALVANRVPIIEALAQARASVPLSGLQHRLDLAGRDVKAGVRLADSLETHRVLDATSISLVRVGERAGELAAMLAAIARYWGDINRNRMKRLLALLEPVAILAIGAAIGFVMFGVMLAIASLSNLAV